MDVDVGLAALAAELGERGAAFWRATVEGFELRADELQLLLEVCRSLDLADALQAEIPAGRGFVVGGSRGQPVISPVVSELRSVRLAIGAMLKQLRLPDDETDGRPTLSQMRSAAGQKGAQSRWQGGRRHGS
jgi:hypothetical protein